MKKIFLITLALLITSTLKVFAAEVGYVDYKVAFKQIPEAVKYQKQIDEKIRQTNIYILETRKILNENKTLTEQQKKDIALRKANINKLKKEYSDLVKKQEALVVAKVKEGSLEVIKSGKVKVILNIREIVAGGIDVTQDVLKAIR